MLVTTGLVLAMLVLAQRALFERGLKRYARNAEQARVTEFASELADTWETDGDWRFLEGRERWPRSVLRPALRRPPAGRRGREGGPRAALPPERMSRMRSPWWTRLTLVDTDGAYVAGARSNEGEERLPIVVDEVTVGYLVHAPLTSLSDELQISFARKQLQQFAGAGLVAFIIAAFASAFFARSLGAPIRELTEGAQALADGDYNARVSDQRKDELGELATSFNAMASALTETRAARRRWVADIAHELRTPLSVLRGEIEALEDGVRPFDDKAVTSLRDETQRLGALVDDLHQLAQADAGSMTLTIESLSVAETLQEVTSKMRTRFETAGLQLECDVESVGDMTLDADRLRVRQLLLNLLENALRYTDAGGKVVLSATPVEETMLLSIEDGPPGVPDDALPRLFDRLYRVDPSRNRATGASGLGLAICRSIVEAHAGRIDANHSAMGGLKVTAELPRQQRS